MEPSTPFRFGVLGSMATLVLPPLSSADSRCLWEGCFAQPDWEAVQAYRWRAPKVKDPVLYGELTFCDVLAPQLGIHLLEPPDDFLVNLDRQFTRRKVELMPHAKARTLGYRRFIKPANDKVFEARVYELGEHIAHRYIDPKTPCLVSDPVELHTEYRCYVLDGRVQTLSAYRWAGMTYVPNRDATEAARDFAHQVLRHESCHLPSAVVLDVGFIPGSGLVVIEANQAYASGIYHEADVVKVLPVLARAAGSKPVSTEDLEFVRDMV